MELGIAKSITNLTKYEAIAQVVQFYSVETLTAKNVIDIAIERGSHRYGTLQIISHNIDNFDIFIPQRDKR